MALPPQAALDDLAVMLNRFIQIFGDDNRFFFLVWSPHGEIVEDNILVRSVGIGSGKHDEAIRMMKAWIEGTETDKSVN